MRGFGRSVRASMTKRSTHSLSTDEWMAAIEFLTRTGQKCTPLRQEMTLLSSVLGVSALVGSLNNPVVGGATESSILGPFYTEDAEDGEPLHTFTTPQTLPYPSRTRRFDCIRGQRRIHVRRRPGFDNRRQAHRRCSHRDMGSRSQRYGLDSMGAPTSPTVYSPSPGFYDTQYEIGRAHV